MDLSDFASKLSNFWSIKQPEAREGKNQTTAYKKNAICWSSADD